MNTDELKSAPLVFLLHSINSSLSKILSVSEGVQTSAHRTSAHRALCPQDLCPQGHLPTANFMGEDICPQSIFVFYYILLYKIFYYITLKQSDH